MTPDDAAAVLGVARDATAAQVQAAYRRRARDVHPDRGVGSSDQFVRVAQARDVLLEQVGMDARPPRRPRPHPWRLIAVWVGLALLAALLQTSGSALPFSVAEPVLRFAILIAALVGYAITGRRAWLVVAVIALAATVVLDIAFVTLGSLAGLLLMIAPVYGLLLIGRSR